jgi:hypothetical protein
MFLKRPGSTPGKSGQRKTCAGSRLLFLAEVLESGIAARCAAVITADQPMP